MKKLFTTLSLVLLALLISPLNVISAPSYRLERTLMPEQDSTYNLGSSTNRWLHLFSDNATTTRLTIDGIAGCDTLDTDGAGNVVCGVDSAGVSDHGALTGLGDDDHTQYVIISPSTSTRNVITPSVSGTTPLSILGAIGQTANLFKIATSSGLLNATTTYNRNSFYVDSAGDVHVGIKSPATGGSNCNSDSYRLYLDGHFSSNGSSFGDRSAFMQVVPVNECANGEQGLEFWANNSKQLVVGNPGGGIVMPNGATIGGILFGSASSFRTVNGGAMTMRSEFNTNTLQGEKNTVGGYDNIILGKNPFGTVSASNILGILNDTIVVGKFSPYGPYSFLAGTTTASYARAGGILYASTTTQGNTAATETDLFSYPVATSTLASLGDTIEFASAGTFANTASVDKRVKVKFGGDTIFDSGNIAAIATTSWSIKGTLMRVTQTSTKTSVDLVTSFSSLPATTSYFNATSSLTSTVNLIITGNGTNANDTVGQMFKVKWE